MTPTGTATETPSLGQITDLAATVRKTIVAVDDSDETARAKVVLLTEAKRELDALLKLTKERIAPLHDEILTDFADRGVTSERDAVSGRLVYVNRRVWARAGDGVDKDQAYDALVAAGLDTYAERGFNTHSLSAYFRELVKTREAQGEPVTDLADVLPEELRGVIALTDDHTLGVRS